jgi:hypothetical protein
MFSNLRVTWPKQNGPPAEWSTGPWRFKLKYHSWATGTYFVEANRSGAPSEDTYYYAVQIDRGVTWLAFRDPSGQLNTFVHSDGPMLLSDDAAPSGS